MSSSREWHVTCALSSQKARGQIHEKFPESLEIPWTNTVTIECSCLDPSHRSAEAIMDENPPAYAIVIARGGSKRIPGKNIRTFHGKPLIRWPLDVLVASGLFKEVIVSTDSPEIATVAKESGASIPFERPAPLADDYATTADVANHAIDYLIEQGMRSDAHICLVYPAAVWITKDLLENARALIGGDTEFVFSACLFPSPVERAWEILEDSEAKPWMPEFSRTRTQDLPPKYYDAGQFYWSRVEAWTTIAEGQRPRSRAFVLRAEEAVDIDTEEDWIWAEKLFSTRQYHP